MQEQKRAQFPTTLWTRVAHASDLSHPIARAAYEELFQYYWYPIYAFIRRWGVGTVEAEDLTQGFLAHVYEKGKFRQADRNKGRFRTFMLTCLKNFMADEYDRRTALQRGGGVFQVSFDSEEARNRYEMENADNLTPEKLFNRKVAQELLDSALGELAEEASSRGHGRVFEALRPRLASDDADESYKSIADRLGMEINTVKSHSDRFRRRFRELIRERVAQTVANDDDIGPETVALDEAL